MRSTDDAKKITVAKIEPEKENLDQNYDTQKKKLTEYLNQEPKERLSGHQTAVYAIEHFWSLKRDEKIRLLLNCKNTKKNINLGMLIASEGDNLACQSYLALLKTLHQEGCDIRFLYALLAEKGECHWPLGHYIAKSCNLATIEQYIELLKYLQLNQITARQLFNLISIQSEAGFNFLNNLARYNDKKSLDLIFELLYHFSLQGIKPTEIIEFVNNKMLDNWSLGHQIARYHKAETIIYFLDFLNNMGMKKEDICALLHTKTNNNVNMYKIMVYYNDAKNLYQLICAGVFLDLRDKTILDNHLKKNKEKILDFILSLPLAEKIKALENALTPAHPLYDFFAIKRGIKDTNLESGTFQKIQVALKKAKETPDITALLQKSAEKIIQQPKIQLSPLSAPIYDAPLYIVPPVENYHYPVNAAASGLYPVLQGNHFTQLTATAPVMTTPYTPPPAYDFVKFSTNVVSEPQKTPATSAPLIIMQPTETSVSTSFLAMFPPIPQHHNLENVMKEKIIQVENKKETPQMAFG